MDKLICLYIVEIMGLIFMLSGTIPILLDIYDFNFSYHRGGWDEEIIIWGISLIWLSFIFKRVLKLKVVKIKKSGVLSQFIILAIEFTRGIIFVFVGAMFSSVFLKPWSFYWTKNFIVLSIGIMFSIFLVSIELEKLSKEYKEV